MVVLPHGLRAVQQPATLSNDDRKPSSSFSTTTSSIKKISPEELKKAANPRGLPKATPDNKYRLMPGATPFPDWSRPTPEECRTVYDILKYAPLSFTPPAKILPPSTTVAGCGEVPDLVDAMMRTLISQSVTRDSANMVVERIIARFGQLDPQGIGAASIDWNAVRLAPPEDVIQTLHKGGLQNRKYEGIKECLDMIYMENQVRRSAYMDEKKTGKVANVPGATEMTTGQKEHQLKKIEAGILTLDHIRAMPADGAMMALIKHPQIGVKTAACLLLFCLQMPSFAVDTHVYRMCKWLYWVPGTENENYVYMHCNVRVPDHLKYGLHQLFIEHGSGCHRCKGSTSKGTAEWDKAVCPLEHLLDRYSKKESKSKVSNAVDIENDDIEAHEGHKDTVQADAMVKISGNSEQWRGE
ncbi:DNA glycosylase [Colletotrichum falcatum]|nr:DNA glycosylase [Colletotrichum falcatum]